MKGRIHLTEYEQGTDEELIQDTHSAHSLRKSHIKRYTHFISTLKDMDIVNNNNNNNNNNNKKKYKN